MTDGPRVVFDGPRVAFPDPAVAFPDPGVVFNDPGTSCPGLAFQALTIAFPKDFLTPEARWRIVKAFQTAVGQSNCSAQIVPVLGVGMNDPHSEGMAFANYDLRRKDGTMPPPEKVQGLVAGAAAQSGFKVIVRGGPYDLQITC